MNKQDKIALITVEYEKDEYGVQRKNETITEIFADVQSISANELFQAGQNGYKPMYRMDIYAFEYNNQSIIEYNGQRYSIYRKYQSRQDILELYVQKEIGT